MAAVGDLTAVSLLGQGAGVALRPGTGARGGDPRRRDLRAGAASRFLFLKLSTRPWAVQRGRSGGGGKGGNPGILLGEGGGTVRPCTHAEGWLPGGPAPQVRVSQPRGRQPIMEGTTAHVTLAPLSPLSSAGAVPLTSPDLTAVLNLVRAPLPPRPWAPALPASSALQRGPVFREAGSPSPSSWYTPCPCGPPTPTALSRGGPNPAPYSCPHVLMECTRISTLSHVLLLSSCPA